MKTRFVIVMGVSGSGKTSIGKALAQTLTWDSYDADDFHPPANVAKMAAGMPLDDSDRAPWLTALHDLIASCLKANRPGVQTVYLKGSYDLIWSRMQERTDHYMKSHMLKSQFEALEEPAAALTIDVSGSVDDIVKLILKHVE